MGLELDLEVLKVAIVKGFLDSWFEFVLELLVILGKIY